MAGPKCNWALKRLDAIYAGSGHARSCGKLSEETDEMLGQARVELAAHDSTKLGGLAATAEGDHV